MKKIFSLIALGITLITLNSCTKEGPAGPAGSVGPAGTSLKGTLTGNVSLINQNGEPQTDNSGVTLSMGAFSATTDMAGKFKIENIPTNTYNVKISKTGYAEQNQILPFVGGDVAYIYNPNKFLQNSTRVIDNLTQSNLSYNSVGFTINSTPSYSGPGYQFPYVAYFSTKADVSNTNYESDSKPYLSGSSESFSYNNTKFPAGTKVYYSIYTINAADNGYDNYEKPNVYPTINVSSAKTGSFIVPLI